MPNWLPPANPHGALVRPFSNTEGRPHGSQPAPKSPRSDWEDRLDACLSDMRFLTGSPSEAADERPSDYEKRTVAELWKCAPEWTDQVHLLRLCLKWVLLCTPWDFVKPGPSVPPVSVTELDALLDHGLIVTAFEPRTKIYGLGYDDASHTWRVFRQRAYMGFLVPTHHPRIRPEAVARFLDRLVHDPRIATGYAYEFGPHDPPPPRPVPAPVWNVPDAFQYTEDKEARAFERLLVVPWRGLSGFSGAEAWKADGSHLVGREDGRPFPASLAAAPIHVTIFDREWTEGRRAWDLDELVLGHLSGAGLEPGFNRPVKEEEEAHAHTDQEGESTAEHPKRAAAAESGTKSRNNTEQSGKANIKRKRTPEMPSRRVTRSMSRRLAAAQGKRG